MKKASVVFLCIVVSSVAFAQQSNPFAGSQWQGRITYRDAANVSHIDTYNIILVANSTCIVTLRTRQDGKDIFQDADGTWSYDGSFFRLECAFPDPVIDRVPSINWASLYQLDAMQNRFTLMVEPYPGANYAVKAAFVRVDD